MPAVTATRGPSVAPRTTITGTSTDRAPSGTSATHMWRSPGGTVSPTMVGSDISPLQAQNLAIIPKLDGVTRCVLRDEWGDVVSTDGNLRQIRIAPCERVDQIQMTLDNADRVILVVREA